MPCAPIRPPSPVAPRRTFGRPCCSRAHTTHVATPDGDVLAVRSAPTWLATAGAGDALAGIIGALLATHSDRILDDPLLLGPIAAAGAVIHGRAAERAGGGGPFTILDLCAAIPATIVDLLRLRADGSIPVACWRAGATEIDSSTALYAGSMADVAARSGGVDTRRGVLTNPITLWGAFVLVHLWLGFLCLFGPGLPLGDVTLVYSFWVDQGLDAGIWVGIDTAWVYPIVALIPMIGAPPLRAPVLREHLAEPGDDRGRDRVRGAAELRAVGRATPPASPGGGSASWCCWARSPWRASIRSPSRSP